MSDGGTDQFEMQSKEADSKSNEDIAQTSSQGYDQIHRKSIIFYMHQYIMQNRIFEHKKTIQRQKASRLKPKSSRKLMSMIQENHQKEALNIFRTQKSVMSRLKNQKFLAEKNWSTMNRFRSKLRHQKHNWSKL